jgi:hypothetical protein
MAGPKNGGLVMKRSSDVLYLAGLFIIAILIGASVTEAQEYSRDLLVKNNTGEDIAGLYMTPHGDRSWGENVLNNTLEYGDTVFVHFSGYEGRCKFDIKVQFANGESETWGLSRTGENFCKDYGVVIEDDGELTRIRHQ